MEGHVLLDGKPVDRAMVMFIPADKSLGEEDSRPAQTITDAEGRYRLNTINKRGAVPGSYKVTVSKTLFPPEYYTTDPKDMGKLMYYSSQGKPALPARYRDQRRTPLLVEVPKGGKKDLVLELTSDPK